VQYLWKNVFDVFDLSFTGVARESLEHGPGYALGARRVVFLEGIFDVGEEVFFMTFLARFALERPAP
jgi:hypothetical protein